jgi:hypothetical protein
MELFRDATSMIYFDKVLGKYVAREPDLSSFAIEPLSRPFKQAG